MKIFGYEITIKKSEDKTAPAYVPTRNLYVLKGTKHSLNEVIAEIVVIIDGYVRYHYITSPDVDITMHENEFFDIYERKI